ncbi:MAG: sensor histidine kinase, partial [bacterium]
FNYDNDLLYKNTKKSSAQLHKINQNLKKRIRDKEEKLKKAQAQLAQAGKLAALGTLGACIAHELNNPLTVISAEADEILDAVAGGYYDARQAEISAKNIKTFAARMRVIINHIRQYTRDDTHTKWRKLNLNNAIQDSLILLKSQLVNEGIEVNLFLNEALPRIWGQYNKLESVFQNLIANAKDAFKLVHDGREKQVTIFSYLDNHHKICIKIRDNAMGMSEQILQHIFKPFYTTKERENGTGLGLAIAHNIVKEHNGEIVVKSEEGKGTEFTIMIPTERRTNSNKSNI